MIQPIPKPAKRGPKPRKPIPKVGRRIKEYLPVQKAYMDAQPTDHRGWLRCEICNNWSPREEMGVDHIKKRGSHGNITDTSNFRVAHNLCNQEREM